MSVQSQPLSEPLSSSPQWRQAVRLLRGQRTVDGGGVELVRVIGTSALSAIDPFLMLDEFGSDRPQAYIAGFPDHPHRGFETITYMLAGRMRHWDNKGHSGLLGPGDVQWMTAGRGLVHSEMPEQQEGLLQGFQFWLNLPASEKMCPPAYQDIPGGTLPRLSLDDADITLIAGSLGGQTGPIASPATRPLIADIRFAQAGDAAVPLPETHNGFVYVYEGKVEIGGSVLERGVLGLLGPGDALGLKAQAGSRLILAAGQPLNEPVVRHGPFVMNSREEIFQAFEDYNANRF